MEIWIMGSYFDQKWWFKGNLNLDGFVSYKHSFLLQKMLMHWSGVEYLWIMVMFLSAVWTLILTAPIHCRGSIGEQVM